jgi:hypothetical protein
MNSAEFLRAATSNNANARLFELLPNLALDQCHLTAGCLFQTVRNQRSGVAPWLGIRDCDVFYFDGDTSSEADDRVIRRLDALTSDLFQR